MGGLFGYAPNLRAPQALVLLLHHKPHILVVISKKMNKRQFYLLKICAIELKS